MYENIKKNTSNTSPSFDPLNTETTFSKTHHTKFRLNTTSSKFRKIKIRDSNNTTNKIPKSPNLNNMNATMNKISLLERYSEASKFKKYDAVFIF